MSCVIRKDLSVTQGIAYPDPVDPQTYTWATGPDALTATNMDLTGATGIHAVRGAFGGTPLISHTQATGLVLGAALAGHIKPTFTGAEIAALPIGWYVHDITITPALGPYAGLPVLFMVGNFYVGAI